MGQRSGWRVLLVLSVNDIPLLRSVFLAVALVVVAGISGGGCRDDGQGEADSRPNVLLIVSDTTRADRLGCYGNPLDLTPHLDALSSKGVRFAEARAHAP